jgi:hypothetical protein
MRNLSIAAGPPKANFQPSGFLPAAISSRRQ